MTDQKMVRPKKADKPMASMFHIAPTNFANLLADRPAPRGAAGGAGGGPPCKRKNTTFKIFKKKATTGSQCDDF